MKLARLPQKKARIEIIPMIDTMFFLLVFFMLATLSMTNQYSMPVQLPNATGAQDKVQQVVTLTVTKDGVLYYDKEPVVSKQDAVSRLLQRRQEVSQLSVIINADRRVEHGLVVELMDSIQQIGIPRIAVAVKRGG